jgi:hypothetical protein
MRRCIELAWRAIQSGDTPVGSLIRQRLTPHSDTERSFSYVGIEPFEFLARDRTDVPAAIDYAGTLRLSPVIDGARTLIEWFVDFDCPPDAHRAAEFRVGHSAHAECARRFSRWVVKIPYFLFQPA